MQWKSLNMWSYKENELLFAGSSIDKSLFIVAKHNYAIQVEKIQPILQFSKL